jgi:hypothetical protein
MVVVVVLAVVVVVVVVNVIVVLVFVLVLALIVLFLVLVRVAFVVVDAVVGQSAHCVSRSPARAVVLRDRSARHCPRAEVLSMCFRCRLPHGLGGGGERD